MPLVSYKDARPWAKAIKQAVLTRKMPPWLADPHYGAFRNDRRLSDDEIKAIVDWVDGGAPEGDPKQMPPLPEFETGLADRQARRGVRHRDRLRRSGRRRGRL